MTRRLLFHRDFRAYQGGHGKVRDYVRHAAAHVHDLYLTPEAADRHADILARAPRPACTRTSATGGACSTTSRSC